MNVQIENRQRSVCINRRRITALTRELYKFAERRAAKCSGKVFPKEITLIFTGNREIAAAHAAATGAADTTDVITLEYLPAPGFPGTGELIINARMAAEICGDSAWTLCDELALYIAHGLDHLSGADDLSTEQRGKMRRRELRWLSKCRSAGLLSEICSVKCARNKTEI